ncbi:MAG: hypothetical protein JST75_19320 [Bacteroidetes bacterium]|nr:hypothetical protein [Bacteroidota bacterium]
MKNKKYEPVFVSPDKKEYKFTSAGPKGNIEKIVQFTQTDNPDIFNIALGSRLEHGAIDYSITHNNQDRNQILETVKNSVYEFTSEYPDKSVFYKGNTIEKTRLYRLVLTKHFHELSHDFEIFGVLKEGIGFFAEQFVSGKEYFGFLLKRKFCK